MTACPDAAAFAAAEAEFDVVCRMVRARPDSAELLARLIKSVVRMADTQPWRPPVDLWAVVVQGEETEQR